MVTRDNILSDIHPSNLKFEGNTRIMEFDNKYDVLEFLKKNEAAGSSIGHTEKFHKDLIDCKVDKTEVEKVKNEVLNNLIKRGIITGTVYEGYKYSVEGEIIDHAMLASGNPNCMMTPLKKYDKWFYELYINMSIPGSVDESSIKHGAIKLIETIKALEELNIEIKVNIVDYSGSLYYSEDVQHLLVVIPLISHLDFKDYKNLMPFIQGSFLRGPLFTIARNSIDKKENVDSSMGRAIKLKNSVNLWDLNEVVLAERILGDLDLLGAL